MTKSLSLKQIVIILIIALTVGYCLYSYFTNWRYIGQENLVFSVDKVKGEEGFLEGDGESTSTKLRKDIYSQNWKNDTTMIIKAVDWYRCGKSGIWGSYKVEGDTITVFAGEKKFGFKLLNVAEACILGYTMTYEISNLEHKEYQVKYVRI